MDGRRGWRHWGAGARAALLRSLSGRLLLLTVGFVLISEAIIYLPSITGEHARLLEARLAIAQVAVLPLEETSNEELSPELRREILANAGVLAVVLKRSDTRSLFLRDAMPLQIDAVFDTREPGMLQSFVDAFDALMAPEGRIIRIIGTPRLDGGETIDVLMDEAPIRIALRSYAARVLIISLIVSGLVAGLVFLALNTILVRPMTRLIANMVAFRARPEDARRIMQPSGRTDELGLAEETLARMQQDVRAALRQRNHLAALGTAVSKINHDLRNILSSAQMTSDRLSESEDPAVRKLAPRLIGAIDRAIALTTNVLSYAKAEDQVPRCRPVPLAPLVEDIALAAQPSDGSVRIENIVPRELILSADPDQIFRILMNLTRNAVDALKTRPDACITITARSQEAWVAIEIADNGPGLPAAICGQLFEPFATTRAGGTGLGLAIAKELAIAHGGDLSLEETGPQGTRFRLVLPHPESAAS